MRYFEMPHFQRFSQDHLGAKDFVAYHLQIKNIFFEVKVSGILERPLKTSDGDSVITITKRTKKFFMFWPVIWFAKANPDRKK
jgi:hypothetical protein